MMHFTWPENACCRCGCFKVKAMGAPGQKAPFCALVDGNGILHRTLKIEAAACMRHGDVSTGSVPKTV